MSFALPDNAAKPFWFGLSHGMRSSYHHAQAGGATLLQRSHKLNQSLGDEVFWPKIAEICALVSPDVGDGTG